MPERPITIADWSPDWAGRFAQKAERIRTALGATALRIDHIGSTSIAGLAAKPIIDIQVSVGEFDDNSLSEAMTVAGYVWRRSVGQ
jgi:GrpB-like predicted nucleotidyltransferase (UPF0157 family)